MGRLRNTLGRPLPPRVSVVQAELDRIRRPRYLEIGVNVGALFLHVRAHEKVAVDPANRIPAWKWLAHPNTALRGRFLERTSDEFFAALEPDERFDVAFIDGLHTHAQSLRDIENALAHLSPDGVVLAHDCNPADALSGGPDPEAAGAAGWCGEVWKTIVHLRATRPDLRVETLDTDFGIGVIRPGASGSPLTGVDPSSLTYGDLEGDRTRLLGLRPP